MKIAVWTIAVLVLVLIIAWSLLKFAIHLFLGGLGLLLVAGVVIWISTRFRRTGGAP